MKLQKRKDALVEQEKQREDLGFGTRITDNSTRLLNRDGSFNVHRSHSSFFGWLNLYHRLISMSWYSFGWLILISFLVVNSGFAVVYYCIGLEYLQGTDMSSDISQFTDAFFFSAQTLTTVGYGRIAPVGFWASFVAAIESLSGLLAFALATGLLYGRFSRPKAQIRFSENALISPYLDTTAFMFRIVNDRHNQLSDVEVDFAISRIETNAQGKLFRKYYTNQMLERKRVTFFPISWTIVHPITEESPLWQVSLQEMLASDTEFLLQIKAIDETFFQTVHARSSYHAREIVWGAKFRPMFDSAQKGTVELDLSLLSAYDKAEIPMPTPDK